MALYSHCKNIIIYNKYNEAGYGTDDSPGHKETFSLGINCEIKIESQKS